MPTQSKNTKTSKPLAINPILEDQRDGNDAVCFTPGFPGATFAAGAIHAYLAADRKPPQVVAGISLGTVSAAVMQRCYFELQKAKSQARESNVAFDAQSLEPSRWAFFNKYLSSLADEPFRVFWNSLPDPTEFFADLPPIKDPVPDTIKDEKVHAEWKKQERAARRELYLLVKLGHWLSRLPLRVSAVASTLVAYVRFCENYPSPKIVRLGPLLMWLTYTLVSFVLQVVRFPTWFPEHRFADWQDDPKLTRAQRYWKTVIGWSSIRPLFGRSTFVACWLLMVFLTLFLGVLSSIFLGWMLNPNWLLGSLNTLAGATLLFFTVSLATLWTPMKGRFPFRSVPMWCTLAAVLALQFAFRTNWIWTSPKWKGIRILDGYPSLPLFLSLHPWLSFWISFSYLLIVIAIAASVILRPGQRDGTIKRFLTNVDMEKHIVHDYHLKHALVTLFGENYVSPPLMKSPFPMVLVASPLQSFADIRARQNNQLWASSARMQPEASKPEAGKPREAAVSAVNDPAPDQGDDGKRRTPTLVDVLRATLAVPAVFDPLTVKRGADLDFWYNPESHGASKDAPRSLDLVDGSVIRHNPLPAFFVFVKEFPQIAANLESEGTDHAKVHVIYNVPAEAVPPHQQDPSKLDTLVDVAFLSMRLAQRRDINLEIGQTNFLSELAKTTRDLRQKLQKEQLEGVEKDFQELEEIYPIFADRIAPDRDLSFASPLAPQRDEVLKHAAAGCKATLERLYESQIKASGMPAVGGTISVDCHSFLAALRRSKGTACSGHSGSPDVCSQCDHRLVVGTEGVREAAFGKDEEQAWKDRTDLDSSFPQLTSEKPRIVFVASGGVFRGPFHAGMISAMIALNVKPDLIVGASVGTLVGGAMAASLAALDHAHEVLGELVSVFQNVDEQIAFTKTLKNAARELGLRGRRVDLSPAELRHKIMQGSKSDAGFAVTGTPPVLIDALSDLLLIPHQQTAKIAAQFVAGHFTDAVRTLVSELKKETLRRLNVVNAVMGASLLEPAARRLLGASRKQDDGNPWFDMASTQPFQKARIALFATTTDLRSQRSVLLGRYRFDTPGYDFINACLASSAFPAVFAPRTDEQIFPGCGIPGAIYSDGGMFDNLPIAPALQLLAASQHSWIGKSPLDPVEALGIRAGRPDLFITGSLDVTPSPYETEFDNLWAIYNRAEALQNNLKIQAFQDLSDDVNRRLQFLHRLCEEHRRNGHAYPASPSQAEYLNTRVNVTLLPVYPTDKDHLNGTFQFCNSLGRDPKIINRSMADGCFQTLRELTIAFASGGNPRSKAIEILAMENRLLRVSFRQPAKESKLDELLAKLPTPLQQTQTGPFQSVALMSSTDKDAQGTKRLRNGVYRRLRRLMSGWAPSDNRYQQAGHACVFYSNQGERQGEMICPFSKTEAGHPIFVSCLADKAHRLQHMSDLVTIAKMPGPEPDGKAQSRGGLTAV